MDPVDDAGSRAYFQFGCLGGVPEEEYYDSGERITEFLRQEGSPFRSWDPPEPDGRRPDGEWGWDPALGEDISRLIAQENLGRRRLVQSEPQDASGFVAELYRHWYRRLGWEDNRLLAQTYTHLDPWWTLSTGSVPFWNRFHMEPSFEVLREYLESSEPYDEVLISLFAHGLVSPGLVSVDRWEELARSSALNHGAVIGIERDAYPVDTGAAFRYQEAFKEAGPHREHPEPLTLEDVDRFAEQEGTRFPAVSWKRG